jgi:hypothetical protein
MRDIWNAAVSSIAIYKEERKQGKTIREALDHAWFNFTEWLFYP